MGAGERTLCEAWNCFGRSEKNESVLLCGLFDLLDSMDERELTVASGEGLGWNGCAWVCHRGG
jgi:hypothetical protein